MFRSLVFGGFAAVVAFGAVGCGGGGDPGTKEMIVSYTEAIETLKGVKDEASAKEAKPKMKSAAEKMKTAIGKVKEPTPDQTKKLEELKGKFGEESKRVAAIPGGAELVMEFSLTAAGADMMKGLKDMLKK